MLKLWGFAPEKVSLIFILENKLQVKYICGSFENLQKTLSIGQKSDFKFQNQGILRKKLFRKFLETSVISLKKLIGCKSAKNFKNF